MFKEGDWVVITKHGYGTSEEDVGLVCKIAKIYKKGKSPAKFSGYDIEIDRDKVGNNDRFTAEGCLRPATSQEIQENQTINKYEIY